MAKTPIKIEASTSGKKGTIRIVDFISMATDSSSERIRAIVDDFLQNGVETVDVYVNSRGGSTVEAVEIANELDRLPSVTLTIGAVAASAATYLMAKFKTRAYSNSQFMIHRPRLTTSGDIAAIQADLKMLENTTEDYRQAYAAKMGKTVEEIDALFAKGDYWMTAKEAKSIGLLDEIIDTKENITAQDIEILTACGAPIIPNVESKSDIEMKNRNQIIAALKLSSDATDEQIEAAVVKAQKAADDAEVVQAKAKTDKQGDVEAFVDQLILDKKATADAKTGLVALGVADFDNLKAVAKTFAAVTKPEPGEGTEGPTAESRKKWTMEDYQEKDPQALATMMTKDPEAFKKLEDDYFGKK